MLKSILLFTLVSLPLVAQAAPGRVIEDTKTRKLERTEVQQPETKRKLEEVEEKHYMTKPTPKGQENVSRRTIVTQPSKVRVPLKRERDRDPDVGTYYYTPTP